MHHKQALVAAGAVLALLQGGNERVAPGFDFVFHRKNLMPLAALLPECRSLRSLSCRASLLHFCHATLLALPPPPLTDSTAPKPCPAA